MLTSQFSVVDQVCRTESQSGIVLRAVDSNLDNQVRSSISLLEASWVTLAQS